MAVKTGTTYTFRRQVTFTYTCSKCGAANVGDTTLSKGVFTSALVRVNPRAEADQYFKDKINSLNNDPVPDRYRDTSLPCRCKKCGNFEPWASDLPRRVTPHLLWFMIVTLMISISEVVPAGTLRFLCLLSGAIPYLLCNILNAVKRGKRLKAIGKLPAHSLPVVW